ncbi:hypothetical protein niasHT_017149 [Heterodera trifolii]|uniref:Transmembrane protein n=1 Tax=Heterodera trifolii TaxID=157864 RepID=A0ABD2L718_9BILA
MALFPLFSRHFFPNYSFLLFFATVSIGLVPSGAVVQTFWKNLFENELPQSDQSAQNFELFAELDEIDSVLTERMSAVIAPPPSPAHPKFQKLYLDKKDKSSGQAHKPKTNKGPLHRLRTIFKRVLLEKKIDGIVQMYKKIKDSPGGWGVLVQKMFTEMVLAKQFGEGSAGESRKNCQTALQLIRDGGDEVGGVQLDKVKPFDSTWSLVKSAAQSLVELFKCNAGGEKARMKRTETLLRVLKTFAMDGNALEGKAAGLKMGSRRQKRSAMVVVIVLAFLAFCFVFGQISVARGSY